MLEGEGCSLKCLCNGHAYVRHLLVARDLDPVEEGRDLSDVGGGSADDLDLLAAAQCDAHGRLLALLHLGLDEQPGGLDLRHPSRGVVVAIDGETGVIEYHDDRFRHYIF